MATININPPAKISRNTAADGDFLWKQDFEVLYNNDIALRNAIEQSTKELTPSSGINIDADKNVSVNKGKGLKFNGNALEVDIEGKGGADVTYEGDKIVVSGYDPTNLIHDVSELEESLDVFSESLEQLEEKAITSADSMQPGTQYVYTTNGWEPIAGGGSQTISYWRPTYNTATGEISWTMDSTINPPANAQVKGDKGDDGDKGDKGDKGDDGISPTVALSPINDGTKTGTEIIITDKTGDHSYSAWNGINGTNGIDGKSVQLSASDVNAELYWRLEGDTTWQDLGYAVSGTVGPRGAQGETGPKGEAPTLAKVDVPADTDHKNGGIKFTLGYSDVPVSAIGIIWHGNNGADGSNTVYTQGPYLSGHGGDPTYDPVGLTDKAIEAIEAVSGKVNKPDTSLVDKYLVLRTDINGVVSGWCDYKSECDLRYMQNHRDYTLSGNGTTNSPLGIDTANLDDNKKYAFTTNGWDEIDDFVKKTGDTMTGNLSVVIDEAGNDSAHRAIIGAYDTTDDSQGTSFAIIGATRKKTNNYGTTWLGVASNGDGVLKNVPNASSAAPNASQSTQLTFGQANNLPVLNLSVQNNNSTSAYKGLAATEASYNGMALSGIESTNNMSGPNYMIAKNAEGQLVIGAAVYNCQGSLPGTLTPNTYYFVY